VANSGNPSGTPGESHSPHSRGRWLTAAAFAALVLVLAAGILLSRQGSSPAAPPAAGSPAAGSATAAASAAAGTCSLPDAPQEIPAAAPASVTWRIYDTIALPFSASTGPQVVSGDVARCYAHTPAGALLAAVQIAVRYVLAAGWRAVLAQQVMPGPGATAYAAQRALDTNVSTSQPGQYGQIAGFQFVTYTPGVAVMQIVTRLPSGALQVTAMTTQWTGTDWRLALHDDGSPGGNVQQVPSLDGFIPWGGT